VLESLNPSARASAVRMDGRTTDEEAQAGRPRKRPGEQPRLSVVGPSGVTRRASKDQRKARKSPRAAERHIHGRSGHPVWGPERSGGVPNGDPPDRGPAASDAARSDEGSSFIEAFRPPRRTSPLDEGPWPKGRKGKANRKVSGQESEQTSEGQEPQGCRPGGTNRTGDGTRREEGERTLGVPTGRGKVGPKGSSGSDRPRGMGPMRAERPVARASKGKGTSRRDAVGESRRQPSRRAARRSPRRGTARRCIGR
jgi:hypothetical protein